MIRESDGWTLSEGRFSAATSRAWEGLFTLGSGYLHVRGSLEEHLSGAPQNVRQMRMPANVTSEKFPETKARWGTYVPGVFGRHPFLNEEMVNLPWFLELAPTVGDERLDVERSQVSEYERTLDLRTATLRRRLVWTTQDGHRLEVCFERFVSAARKHLCVQRLTLRGEPGLKVGVAGGINADVVTNGFDHFTERDLVVQGDDWAHCKVTTNGGDTVEIGTRLSTPGGAQWHCTEGENWNTVGADLCIPAQGELVVEKRSAVTTSRDPEKRSPESYLDEAAARSFDALHVEHAAVWAKRWERCDVEIDGHPESQLWMRVSLYHLLRAHVEGDSRVGIDAKGYAGEGYFGRYFWDTEMYLLPFYLYTQPDAARTLLEFRLQTVPGARETAAARGYRGIRFPWESDHRGHDCCHLWQYGDHEVHVTADVVYAFDHYARAADPKFVTEPKTADAIVEAARYWLDRMDQRPGDDYPSLLGVMGPDEYTPISHNNAYTNWMVRHAFELAREVADQGKGGATEQERRGFVEAAESLPIPRRGDLVLQCEDWDMLAPPRFDDLWPDRSRPFAAQVPQERLYRSKCLKQADVILLQVLFPHRFSDAECRAAWDEYVPVTTHDSSLSKSIHAIMALRLGLEAEAWQFWGESAGLDLDVAHGGAAEGMHIACCAGNWQVAVFGFAGMRTAMQAEVLTLAPRLPAQWSRLAFSVTWQGTPCRVEIVPGECRVTNLGTQPLAVCVAGQKSEVSAGATVLFATGTSRS